MRCKSNDDELFNEKWNIMGDHGTAKQHHLCCGFGFLCNYLLFLYMVIFFLILSSTPLNINIFSYGIYILFYNK